MEIEKEADQQIYLPALVVEIMNFIDVEMG
jgi:hypothetical protein